MDSCEHRQVLQPSRFRYGLVLFIVLSIVSAEFVLLFNPTARGWPFASIHVFKRPGHYQHQSFQLRVWAQNSEQTLIDAGLVRYNLQTCLLHHAGDFKNLSTIKSINDFLKARAQEKGLTFQGFRVYRVVWDLKKEEIVQRDLVHQEAW